VRVCRIVRLVTSSRRPPTTHNLTQSILLCSPPPPHTATLPFCAWVYGCMAAPAHLHLRHVARTIAHYSTVLLACRARAAAAARNTRSRSQPAVYPRSNARISASADRCSVCCSLFSAPPQSVRACLPVCLCMRERFERCGWLGRRAMLSCPCPCPHVSVSLTSRRGVVTSLAASTIYIPSRPLPSISVRTLLPLAAHCSCCRLRLRPHSASSSLSLAKALASRPRAVNPHTHSHGTHCH
jgi:hypothetical protein